MQNNEFLNTLLEGFHQYGYNMSDKKISKLVKFNKMVMDVNKHTNLTAIADGAESAKKHFLDSVNPVAINIIKNASSVIDIGSGAGFPGIPLAILNENIQFTLLDTRKKRCEFIEYAAGELGIKNVSVVWGRAEDLGKDISFREQYDIACARALAFMPVLLEYLSPFVKINSQIMLYKGKEAKTELTSSENASKILGMDEFKITPYTIINDSSYNMISAKKAYHTPDKYPRKAGIPLKRPL